MTDAIDDDLAMITGYDRLQGSTGLARPWNLRAFIDALPENQRDRIRSIRATGPAAYAWMTALAQGIDGTAGPEELIELTAITTELDIPRQDAEFCLDAMVNAGWADRAGPAR